MSGCYDRADLLMITFLKVRNLAIVEEFAIEPGSGLNVLTGETGAGKSLLIDSLDFISGARGSTELVRAGSDKMNAEAVFHLPIARAKGLFESSGIELEVAGDGEAEIIVRREMSSAGRGRVLVNGSPLSVRELVELMDALLEIHGQNQTNGRIAGQSMRELLDTYAGVDDLGSECRKLFEEWKAAASELEKLRAAQQDRSLKLDLLKYQMDEISAAQLEPGEEEQLREERAILAHAQETIAAAAGAFQLLDEDETSALDRLSRSMQLVHPLSRSIEAFASFERDLEDVRIRLQEIARSLSSLAESVRHDPARLDEAEERLATIERLKKKYGASIDEILVHLEKITSEYDTLAEYESSLDSLQQRTAAALNRYAASAHALSQKRTTAARKLEREIERELQDLAMERTSISISMSVGDDATSELRIAGRPVAFGPHGFDRVEMLIAPNRGDELRPMQKIASGGELSRIQLAAAAALFKNSTHHATATLVFDEIDSGVGGRVAEAVGRKLQELSRSNQVICVTHLPQIASLGSAHFRVWKEDASNRTRARIEKLETHDQRVEEIARMLGGDRVTATAREHAATLLSDANPRSSRKRSPAASVSKD